MSCLTAAWHWLANPPTTQFHEALIAIASVSAVLWTGGLIVRQLTNYVDVQFRAAIEFIGFAFFAPMFGLFISGNTLRVTAAVFLVYYLKLTYKTFRDARDIELGKIQPPANMAPDFVPQWKKNGWMYLWLSLLSDFAILVVIVLPFDQAIAWTSVLMDYLGYQIILSKFFSLQQDFPMSASLFLILQRVTDISERVKRVIPDAQPNPQPPPVSQPTAMDGTQQGS